MTQANNVAIESSQINSSGVLQPAGGGTGVTTSTGSGSNVLNTSPTLVTPALGTPSSGNLVNCTGFTSSQITTALGYTPANGIQSTGQQTVSSSITLTSSNFGADILILTSGITVTMPTSASSGQSIFISNVSSGAITISYAGSSGTDGPTTLPNGYSLLFFSDGGAPPYWRCFANTTMAIGVNQTWQNVTSSRALSTTYTNSTGKPIQVNAWMTVSGSPAGNTDIELTIGGVLVAYSSMYFSSAAGNRVPFVTGIVPNGATYSAAAPSGAGTLSWMELR